MKRAVALQLLQLDALEVAFGEKALVDRDVAAGMLLVRAPGDLARHECALGHAVAVVHEPVAAQSSTEQIDAANRLHSRQAAEAA